MLKGFFGNIFEISCYLKLNLQMKVGENLKSGQNFLKLYLNDYLILLSYFDFDKEQEGYFLFEYLFKLVCLN